MRLRLLLLMMNSLRLLIGHKKKHRRSLALAVFWKIGDKSPNEIIETKPMHAVV
jgi:hypothetical protein